MENPTLRKLKVGEKCYVARKYSTDKNFNFNGSEKIESLNDVAYIFRKLQTASVENFFVVYDKEGIKPVIQHLSMGIPTATFVEINAIRDGINRFNPDKVYLVHNHPSGNVKPSLQDLALHEKCKEIFGDKIQEGIIINTISGNYSVFDKSLSIEQERVIPLKTENTPYKVLKFDRQVFSKDVGPLIKIKSSMDIAEYVSAQRFSNQGKQSVLILKQNNIAANIHLNEGKITDKNYEEIAKDIASYTARFAGTAAIIYGKDNEYDLNYGNQIRYAKEIKQILKEENINLVDFLNIKIEPYIDVKYEVESAVDQGLWDDPKKSKKNTINNISM